MTLSHFCKTIQILALLLGQTSSFFEDLQKLNHLKIELAAIVDWDEVLVKAMYNLEGDGPLALTCFETIQEI